MVLAGNPNAGKSTLFNALSGKNRKVGNWHGVTVDEAGLLAVFFLVVVLYLCGIDQIVCLGLGLVGATLVVWQTFAMNRKYGRYGLMKQGSIKMHPRYLLNRRTVFHLIRNLKPKRKA